MTVFARRLQRPPHRQHGVALVVVLLFTSALAVGGLYSARSALLGERLARAQMDQQVARQAAETALRDAEIDLSLAGGASPAGAACSRGATRPVDQGLAYFTDDCRAGQCAERRYKTLLEMNYAKAGTSASTGSEAWWPENKGGRWNSGTTQAGKRAACDTFTGAVPLGTYTGAAQVNGVARQPEYLIEGINKAGGAQTVFRITARGFGYRTDTEVVVQSYFLVPSP